MDVQQLVKTIETTLREAQSLMFNGKPQESAERLSDVRQKLAELRAADPGFARLAALEKKAESQQTDVDRRLKKSPSPPAAGTAAATPTAAPSPAAPSPGGTRLAAGVTKRLKDMDRLLSGIEPRLADAALPAASRADSGRSALPGIRELWREIVSGYPADARQDHPEIAPILARLEKAERETEALASEAASTRAAADSARAAGEARSGEWIARIEPFVRASSGSVDRCLWWQPARAPADFEQHRRLLAEARATAEEYRAAAGGFDRTHQLEQIERDLDEAIAAAAASLDRDLETLMEAARGPIERIQGAIAGDGAWRADEATLPSVYLNRRERREIEEAMAAVEALVGPTLLEGNPDFGALRQSWADLLAEHEGRDEARARRLRLSAETYSGPDAGEIKAAAEALVRAAYPQARVLRVSLYKNSWFEEDVVEHTDTTRTALRHRVTRWLPAQAAAEEAGRVYLHTVRLARNRQSDGTFGALYGNCEEYPVRIERGNVGL